VLNTSITAIRGSQNVKLKLPINKKIQHSFSVTLKYSVFTFKVWYLWNF